MFKGILIFQTLNFFGCNTSIEPSLNHSKLHSF